MIVSCSEAIIFLTIGISILTHPWHLLFCTVPFYKPDIHITLVDALRPMDELHYFPGETNVRMADMILVTKVDQLDSLDKANDQAKKLEGITKPRTPVFFGASVITPEATDPATGAKLSTEAATNLIKGKRVLVIDDGPTLTHGGMSYGAGYVCAKNLGAGEIVDPRPYAKGSLVDVFAKFQHLQNVLPAMGYGDEQVRDLEATIKATPCDAVLIGTPSDITHLFDVEKPFVTARYELEVVKDHEEQFEKMLDTFYNRYNQHHHDAALLKKWEISRERKKMST
jgi:predicted GTPase